LSFEDFQGKYDVMVGANSKALRLAWRAESRRILHNNPGVREAEYNQQCSRRPVPEYREMNNLSTRKDELLHAETKKQGKQKTKIQHNGRLNPKTRSLEKSVITFRRAAACKDEEIRERENEQ
jgi:hypothetical protein